MISAVQGIVWKDLALFVENPPQNNEDFYRMAGEIHKTLGIMIEVHDNCLTLIKNK